MEDPLLLIHPKNTHWERNKHMWKW